MHEGRVLRLEGCVGGAWGVTRGVHEGSVMRREGFIGNTGRRHRRHRRRCDMTGGVTVAPS